MESDDAVRVAIDRREYSVISGRLEAIEKDNREIHAELRDVNTKLDLLLLRMCGLNERIDDMKFLTFGALAVFVAAVTLSTLGSRIMKRLID